MEAQGDPLKDGLNAAKPLLTRFCVAKSVTYPPNLPDPPRTSPMSPPFKKRKFGSLFVSGGDMGEVFVGLGGIDFLKGAAVALFLWVVCLDITPYTSAEIPPAGAPSGFDSAAKIGFRASRYTGMPLRSG